jgi:hypothetical protein
MHKPAREYEFCHLLFQAVVLSGQPTPSDETSEVAFFAERDLPGLSDGHKPRLEVGFRALRQPESQAYFE